MKVVLLEDVKALEKKGRRRQRVGRIRPAISCAEEAAKAADVQALNDVKNKKASGGE